jgi:hypothetical protein
MALASVGAENMFSFRFKFFISGKVLPEFKRLIIFLNSENQNGSFTIPALYSFLGIHAPPDN